MTEFFLPFLQELLMVVVTVGVGYLIAFIKKKLGVENMKKVEQESKLVREIVEAGVRYAEQRFASGQKLDAAYDWVSASLTAKGIKVSDKEIEGLIESTIRQFKDEFGEEWANVVKEETDKKQ